MLKDDFSLGKIIGKGIFGDVYEGLNKKTNEKVALKKMNIDRISGIGGDYLLSTIKTEEENMKKCESLNTVKIFGHYEDGNNHIMVMELCDETLQKYLKNKNGLSSDEIYDIFSQLNNSFKKMYENNIIHRDLKLENILIKYINKEKTKFIPKLTDFGFSKSLKNYSTKTVVGTLQMIAPEIIKGQPYASKADLWSLGLMIYYCYFKEYPYNGKNKNNIIKALNQGIKLKRPKGIFLADLIDKLLVVDPKKRISWKEYFNHPFFKYSSLSIYNTCFSNVNFNCFSAEYNSFDKTNNIENVLIKSYKKNYLSNVIYEKEYELFKKYKNNKNVLKLIDKFEYNDENNDIILNFVFELNDFYNPFYLYSNINKLEEKEINDIANILYNIYSKIEDKYNSHIFISLHSFLISVKKDLKLYDFGLNKYILPESELKIYYCPNLKEMRETPEPSKTIVMNYGIVLLLIINNNKSDIIIEKNQFVLKTQKSISHNLYSFLEKCLCPNITNRPNFKELNLMNI